MEHTCYDSHKTYTDASPSLSMSYEGTDTIVSPHRPSCTIGVFWEWCRLVTPRHRSHGLVNRSATNTEWHRCFSWAVTLVLDCEKAPAKNAEHETGTFTDPYVRSGALMR